MFTERKTCIFCNCIQLKECVKEDLNIKSPLSYGLTETKNDGLFMPYNILICNNCKTAQTKYLADLNILYNVNHIDDYGTIKSKKFLEFSDFIKCNKDINGFIEVGTPHCILANELLSHYSNTPYTIIEPSIKESSSNINIIHSFIEDVDIDKIQANAIIMSDVFEHFYEPLKVLEKISKSNIKYIYLNHPDFDYHINNNMFTCLNSEHTFLVEHQFLFSLFENYGFRLNKMKNLNNFSLFLLFERIDNNTIPFQNRILNINMPNTIDNYVNSMLNRTTNMNLYMIENKEKKFYIWPSSIHSTTLFQFGLDYKKLSGVLDNSPNKIGKYQYAYNLQCSSFDDMVKNGNEDVVIFISGAGNYIKEISLQNSKIEIININNL